MAARLIINFCLSESRHALWINVVKHMAMPMRILLVLMFLCNFNCSGQEKIGKAEIVELEKYQKEDEYFPHDCSMESDMLERAIELDKDGSELIIKNIANDGYTGHSIAFRLNSKMEVKKAEYNEWTDAVDGSSTNYKIYEIELKLNSGPFKSNKLIRYYKVYMTGYYKSWRYFGKRRSQRRTIPKKI